MNFTDKGFEMVSKEGHICPIDESGLCDDCPCHTKSQCNDCFIDEHCNGKIKGCQCDSCCKEAEVEEWWTKGFHDWIAEEAERTNERGFAYNRHIHEDRIKSFIRKTLAKQLDRVKERVSGMIEKEISILPEKTGREYYIMGMNKALEDVKALLDDKEIG